MGLLSKGFIKVLVTCIKINVQANHLVHWCIIMVFVIIVVCGSFMLGGGVNFPILWSGLRS